MLTLSKEDLGDLLAESGSYSTAEDIREFALTLTVKADGTVTGSLVYRPSPTPLIPPRAASPRLVPGPLRQ